MTRVKTIDLSKAAALKLFILCITLWTGSGYRVIFVPSCLVPCSCICSVLSHHLGKRELVTWLVIYYMVWLWFFLFVLSSSLYRRWMMIFDCGISLTSSLIFNAIHPAVLDTFTGSKIDLFKFYDKYVTPWLLTIPLLKLKWMTP